MEEKTTTSSSSSSLHTTLSSVHLASGSSSVMGHRLSLNSSSSSINATGETMVTASTPPATTELTGGFAQQTSSDAIFSSNGERQSPQQLQTPITYPIATVGSDWVSGVEKVFQFFERRTPGSYTERTTGTLTWYWDDAFPDLGRQQVRHGL